MLEYKNTNETTTVIPEAPVVEEKINLVPAAAAFLAAGIGCLGYGLVIVLVEAIPNFKKFLTFSNDVGPLSGKVTFGIGIWLLAWVVTYLAMRNRKVNFNLVFIISMALLAVGLLFSFPPFYEIFTAK
jgi:hypothetical protein